MKNFIQLNYLKFIKWLALLIIVASVAFLILTVTKESFSMHREWTTSSGLTTKIGTGIRHTTLTATKVGPGPLQNYTMQILIAFFGGGALGVAGALLQKVTKNRLAEVSILGIGSLNIFFIYIYALVLKGEAYGDGVWAKLMPVFLILVSIVGTIIIWAISRSRKANKNTFVIVGIALQLLIEALSVIVVDPKKLSSQAASKTDKEMWSKIQGYTLGKIRSGVESSTQDPNPVPWWLIFTAIALVVGVIIVIFFLRRKIDTYETSEEIASSTGTNIKLLRFTIFLLVAVLAGASSAILGSVALLGIIAPSVARMLFKNKMMPVVIGSFLIGGVMVALASWLSLQIHLPVQVGILSTAIVIPYFIFQMIREK